MNPGLFGIIVGIIVGLSLIIYGFIEKGRIRHFQDRQETSVEEFYRLYYMNTDIPKEFISHFIHYFDFHFGPGLFFCEGIPANKLRPEDNLEDIKGNYNFSNMFQSIEILMNDSWTSIKSMVNYDSLTPDKQKKIEELFNGIQTINDYICIIYFLADNYSEPGKIRYYFIAPYKDTEEL